MSLMLPFGGLLGWSIRLPDFFACAALLVVLLAALGFCCFLVGVVWLSLVAVLAALAFPCILIGLLASPLCGAAPTFLCRPQRKVGKRKRAATASP
jgi:hypothetical protein